MSNLKLNSNYIIQQPIKTCNFLMVLFRPFYDAENGDSETGDPVLLHDWWSESLNKARLLAGSYWQGFKLTLRSGVFELLVY